MIMKENMISIGLDIGTTKIVAMIGQTNEYNKMKILGVGKSISLGVHRGVVNNITQTIQSIQHAVSEAGKLLLIKRCKKKWCKVSAGEIKGWIKKETLWGLL